eukprot:scaffold2028_cov181-Ochromonas_danica.AAC.3
MFISGLFNGETTSPSHRAAIPASFALTISNGITTGVLFDIERGSYHRRGQLINSTTTYELRWFAHRHIRSLYILEVDIQLHDTNEATFYLTTNTLSSSPDLLYEDDNEQTSSIPNTNLTCASTIIPETSDSKVHRLCSLITQIPSILTVKENQTMAFISSYHTSLDVQDGQTIEEEVTTDYKMAMELFQHGELYSTHISAWDELWQSGIEIHGRGDVATAVNASMFAILSSIREDWPYGLAPGGLTNYYNGHSFWDTETWMYPPILFFHPTIARSLIDYRYTRLDGAHRKAQSYTPPYSGAMFPWESAFSGVETCPTFAATGLREDHISGDISFAIWQQWLLLHDKQWLQDIAYPMLVDIADFWLSRAVYDNSDGLWHIRDIIPPDEYVDHVNDSVYTNYVASLALKYTIQAAKVLNVTENCQHCPQYEEVANQLVLLFNETLQIHPEYQGYNGDMIKQADVVLLHYPLGLEMSDEIRKNDLEYYSIRTDSNGPAMTWGMHSIGYLDLSDYTQAAKYFNMSFQDNLHSPLQVWTETPDGNAVNFITGAGGFLQTMIAGYPGVRINFEDGSLIIHPVCLEGADFIKLRGLHYHKAKVDIEYSCSINEEDGLPSMVKITSRMGKVRVLGYEGNVLRKQEDLMVKNSSLTIQTSSMKNNKNKNKKNQLSLKLTQV